MVLTLLTAAFWSGPALAADRAPPLYTYTHGRREARTGTLLQASAPLVGAVGVGLLVGSRATGSTPVYHVGLTLGVSLGLAAGASVLAGPVMTWAGNRKGLRALREGGDAPRGTLGSVGFGLWGAAMVTSVFAWNLRSAALGAVAGGMYVGSTVTGALQTRANHRAHLARGGLTVAF